MDDNQTQECTEKDERGDESIAKKLKYRQYLAAFTVTILAISNGMAAAWSSPVQGILESKNNPIGNEPMSDSVFTWITSVLYIGSLIGIFIWNRTADMLGRKKNGYLLSLTHVIGWIGITLASNPTHLIISRVIMGLGCCGIISNSQLYISEVVDDDIKRPLCSLILIGMNAGMVLVCLLGWFLPYHILNLICFCPAVIFVVLYFWLPETPLYLLMKNREREAELSMKWYGLEKVENGDIAKDDNKEQASFTELFATCRMAKITSVTLFLIVGQQMSGIGPLMAYSVNVFKLTGSSMSPYLSSVIVVFLQFVISCVSGVIVKSIPRKPLLLYSYVGAFLSYMMVYAYFFLKDSSNVLGLKYLPIIGVMCFIVAYNLGIGSLPFVVLPEIFPPRLLNHGVSLSLMVLVGGTFTFTNIFSTLKDLLGESGLFLFFSCSNLFFALFVLYFVGERKNHSKDDVEGSPATRRALLRF